MGLSGNPPHPWTSSWSSKPDPGSHRPQWVSGGLRSLSEQLGSLSSVGVHLSWFSFPGSSSHCSIPGAQLEQEEQLRRAGAAGQCLVRSIRHPPGAAPVPGNGRSQDQFPELNSRPEGAPSTSGLGFGWPLCRRGRFPSEQGPAAQIPPGK